MFIFAPLIKCSDNLRDLLQLFLLQFLDLIDRKKRYFIGSDLRVWLKLWRTLEQSGEIPSLKNTVPVVFNNRLCFFVSILLISR